MSFIYLDNNSTTPIDPEVLEEVQRVSLTAFGNPGSRHAAGRKARQVLEDSREAIASMLGALPSEVVFTSGGTEASNLAIKSFTSGRTGSIALPLGEHPATVEVVKHLRPRGLKRVEIRLLPGGQIDQDFAANFPDDLVLVTTLLAHNETGTIQDLTRLADYCQEHRVPMHVDAVQAVGKIPVDFHHLRATTLSIGAHKFYGPRGVGALLVKKECKLLPQLRGGYQESGHRAGTEPVALIAGMALALRKWQLNAAGQQNYLSRLRDHLQSGLQQHCSPAVVNGDQAHRLPNTLNISFPGCDAEALLVALDLAGICCSHGSACASGSSEPSPILLAMGCEAAVYHSAIRFSVGTQNTLQEITHAIQTISEIVRRLRTT